MMQRSLIAMIGLRYKDMFAIMKKRLGKYNPFTNLNHAPTNLMCLSGLIVAKRFYMCRTLAQTDIIFALVKHKTAEL